MRNRRPLLGPFLVATVLLGSCDGSSSGAHPTPPRSASASASVTPPDETAAPAPSSYADLVSTVRAEAASDAEIGFGVLVSLRQGTQHRVLTFGDATVEPRRALRPDDTVMVASVTKTVVGAAVMDLVGDGVLHLSDTVEQWLPGLVPSGSRITVEHLLSMSSGLRSYDTSGHYPGPGVLPAERLVALVNRMNGHGEAFEPGTEGQESNTNYALLQLIVEKATGAPLAQALRDRVLEPAHLRDTALGGTPTAHGYSGSDDATLTSPRFPSAAAGGVSSVGDVGRLLDALVRGDLLDRGLVREMERPRVEVEGEPYGLALRVRDDLPCGVAYGQRGGNDGYAIVAWTVPALDRTVVVAITDGSAEGIASSLADLALCG